MEYWNWDENVWKSVWKGWKMQMRRRTEVDGLTTQKRSTIGVDPSGPLSSDPGWNTTTILLVIFVTMEYG